MLFCQDATEICDELGLCNSTKKATDIAKALDILLPEKKPLIPIMPGPVMLTPPKTKEKSNDVSLMLSISILNNRKNSV